MIPQANPSRRKSTLSTRYQTTHFFFTIALLALFFCPPQSLAADIPDSQPSSPSPPWLNILTNIACSPTRGLVRLGYQLRLQFHHWQQIQFTSEPWPTLSPLQSQEITQQWKEMIQQTLDKQDAPFGLLETDLFLFYTDLPNEQAEQWLPFITEKYRRTALMLRMDDRQNLWHGKAAILLFSQYQHFLHFERFAYLNETTPSIRGICHVLPQGHVLINLWQQTSDDFTAETLVHELTHALLHRYLSPVQLPSWLDEGLAQTLASRAMLRPTIQAALIASARQWIQAMDGLGPNFFTRSHIHEAQYSPAGALVTLMIESRPVEFASFLTAIKQGIPPEESLQKNFELNYPQLTLRFHQTLEKYKQYAPPPNNQTIETNTTQPTTTHPSLP